MAVYALGDIQGCADEFFQILDIIQFSAASDQLFVVGDLVNRGPGSLSVLRWAYRNRHCCHVVLGNHDLHLLAVHAGVKPAAKGDTLAELLDATDIDLLLDWLRRQPLVRFDYGHVFVHAGIYPGWTLAEALGCSSEVQMALTAGHYRTFLAAMYEKHIVHWRENLAGMDRLRCIVDCCTRMRFLREDLSLDLKFKGEQEQAPANLKPWFAFPLQLSIETPIVFGHWSALGLRLQPQWIALDTGCVWGGQLTAIRLSDRQYWQVEAQLRHKRVRKA